jgi:hypothetical protein
MTNQVETLLALAIQAVSRVCEDESYPGAYLVCTRLRNMRDSLADDTPVSALPGTLSRTVVDSWPLGCIATEAVVVAESTYWAWKARELT